MNIKWSLKQIVTVALACTLIGIGGLMLLYQQGVIDHSAVSVNVAKELDVSSIESFSLQTDTIPIKVTSTTGSQIRIRLNGQIRKADAKYADIEMTNVGSSEVNAVVRTAKKYSIGLDVTQLFQLFANKLEVTVELPEKVYRSLSFTTDTGKISLPALKATKLEVNSDTGDIALEGFSGTNLAVKTDTGTMRLNHLSANLSLRSDTGHIIAGLDSLPAASTLQTDTGDIQLGLAKSFPALIDFSADTGKTTIQVPTPSDFNGKRMEKHRLEGLLMGGGPLLKARSDTGDIELVVE